MKTIKLFAAAFLLIASAGPMFSQCNNNDFVVKSTGTGTTCSTIYDSLTNAGFNTGPNLTFALTDGGTGEITPAVTIQTPGGSAGLLLRGGQQTSNNFWPDMGFALTNSKDSFILGASIQGVIISNTAKSEQMDLAFLTKPSTSGQAERLRITNGGNVGIGTSAPTHLLQLSTDDAAKPGTNTWTIASDKRLKTNINSFTDGLSLLRQVNPVKFHYNGLASMPTQKEYVGILAQDIQKIAPYMIGSSPFTDEKGVTTNYLNYDGNAMTYILINSVKELDAKTEVINDLKSTIATLQQQINDLCNGGCASLKGNGVTTASATNVLLQNVPNPFSQGTSIGYVINVGTTAYMNINSLDGKQVKHLPLSINGAGAVTINSNEMAPGTYTYSLNVDGKVVDTKIMVVTSQD